MRFFFKFIWAYLLLNVCSCSVTFVSPQIPTLIDGVMTVIEQVTQSGAEVSVTCRVNNGAPTVWQLGDDTMEYLTFNSNNISVNHSYISVESDDKSVLTIANFTEQLDRFRIICKDSQTISTIANSILIIFGFPANPILLLDPQVHNVIENTTVEISVFTNESDPFPPIQALTSMWHCNGALIIPPSLLQECASCGSISLQPQGMKIESVKRSCSGKTFRYQVAVPPSFPLTTFTLNVLYPPSVELTGISTVFVSVGDNTTLSAVSSITGNPAPFVSWAFSSNGLNSSQIVIIGKYESQSNGQLTINNIEVEDIGDYTITISNGIGEDIVAVISLKEIELRFKSANIKSENGGLLINFILAHTGYETQLDQVSVTLSCTQEEDDPVIRDNLRYTCTRDCINNELMGSGFIRGPVLAGEVYHCSGTVSTSNGSNSLTIDRFSSVSGIPSKPNILNVTVDRNKITIQLHTQFFGDDDTFAYVITLSEESTAIIHNASYVPHLGTVTVNSVSPGIYMLTAYGRNKFGQTPTSASVNITIDDISTTPTSSTTRTILRPTTGPTKESIDSGNFLQPTYILLGVVAGLAILFHL